MHTCIYIYTHTYTYIYIYISTYIYLSTYISTYIYTYLHIYTYTHLPARSTSWLHTFSNAYNDDIKCPWAVLRLQILFLHCQLIFRQSSLKIEAIDQNPQLITYRWASRFFRHSTLRVEFQTLLVVGQL